MRARVGLVMVVLACGAAKAVTPPGSLCVVTETSAVCPYQTTTLEVGILSRNVYSKVPPGDAPDAGWPVVLAFQGSYIGAVNMWHGQAGDSFGAQYQTTTLSALLDHGYAVLTPEVKGAGTTFWDTNIPPYSGDWATSSDHQFMLAIFAGVKAGTFGPLDATRLYATGISSGGYMTSRMAVSYPGTFRALAIAAGSYANCGGPICSVPSPLPSDHPPTLFLHGEKDPIVPIATMIRYRDGLDAIGVVTETMTNPGKGHEWLPEAPAAVPAFFAAH